MKKFHPSPLKKQTFVVQTMSFQAKLPRHCVFQNHTEQYGYETSQNVKQAQKNRLDKNI